MSFGTSSEYLLVLSHVPSFLLPLGSTHDDIITGGRVCLHLDVVHTQMALHPEPVYWSCVVIAHFFLLRIVSNPHADMILTAVTPNIIRHLKSDDEDALRQFPGSFPQRVRFIIAIDRAMLSWVEIRRVVLVHSFTFTHLAGLRSLPD